MHPTENPIDTRTLFIDSFNDLAKEAHDNAKRKGWWSNAQANALRDMAEKLPPADDGSAYFLRSLADRLEKRNDGEMLALIHSEVSEALEALRSGSEGVLAPDDKIPDFYGVEAELADVIIRIMDLSEARRWRVAEAVVAKMEMNRSRAFRHGGKHF